MHDDYVEEYPRSGERIRGKDNARAVYENYPGIPTLIDYSYMLEGDPTRAGTWHRLPLTSQASPML